MSAFLVIIISKVIFTWMQLSLCRKYNLPMNCKVRRQQISLLNKCAIFSPSLFKYASQLTNVDQITSRQHGWGAFRSGFKECYRRLTQAVTLSLTFLVLSAATYVTLIASRHRYKHLCSPSSKHFTLNKCRGLSVPISVHLHNS